MQLTAAWTSSPSRASRASSSSYPLHTGHARAFLPFPTLTILFASMCMLSNQVSAFLYDRQARALGLEDPGAVRREARALGLEPPGRHPPEVRARQQEQLPYDFSPQGAMFDDQNIPSEVLLSDYGHNALTNDNNAIDAPEHDETKRGEKLLPVAFQCGKKTAVCRNHGRGPKVTMSRKRRGAAMCVCLCPPGYTRPQCARNNKPVR